MVFSFRELFFGGRTFCCCLPVRSGVIVMTLLGLVFSGILSIVLWYEVASTPDMTSNERAAFVIPALLETLLFIASILGFVGAVVRKQLFVQIYAYFIYVHFVFNVAFAGFLLWEVVHLTSEAADTACQSTIQNVQAQGQCAGFLKIARGVYFVIAILLLLAEAYGAIIVARYVNQIKSEKRMAKAGLADGPGGYKMAHTKYARLSGHQSQYSASSATVAQSPSYLARGVSPSGGTPRSAYATPRSSYMGQSSYPASVKSFNPYDELSEHHDEPLAGTSSMQPYDSAETGYGGGSWTHSDITAQEKARLRDSMVDEEEDDDYRPTVIYQDPFDDTYSKGKVVPPAPATKSDDDLPTYTPSESTHVGRPS